MNKDEENNLTNNELQDLLDLEILYLEDLANLGQRLKVLKHLANDANSRIAFQIAAEAQIALEPWKFKRNIKKWEPGLIRRHERKKEKFSLANFKKKK